MISVVKRLNSRTPQDPNIVQIKSTIRMIYGILPILRPKFTEDFEKIFGWSAPSELLYWLAIRKWPVNEFTVKHKRNRVLIDLPYYLSSDVVKSILQGLDQGDQLTLSLADPYTAHAAFTGLMFVGHDESGNSVYLDCADDADPDYCGVYLSEKESQKLSENIGYSFSSFIIKTATNYLESRKQELSKSESKAYEFLKQRYKESLCLLKVSKRRHNKVISRAQRANWLIALLAEGKMAPGEELTASPKFSTWKKDEKTIEHDTLLLHYWMYAHYFLGNSEESMRCVEVAEQREGLITKKMAKQVRNLNENPNKTYLGSLSPERLVELKEEIKRYLIPTHHPPSQRKDILDEQGGVADLSPYALIKATRDGDLAKIEELLEAGQDINEPYEFETAIAVAAQSGNVNLAQFLMRNGATVSAPALHWAVIQGDLVMLKVLVSGDDTPDDAYNVQYYFGQSLIHCAIKRDNKETFSHLLKHGADPNLATDFRETPLMEAASMGRFEYIDALIKHGADVNATDDDSKTALHYAAENSVKCIVKLIHQGADVNVADSLHLTPLMIAAEKGNLNGVKELLKYGADRDAQNDEGMTAAQIAASLGHHEIEKYIERFNENRVITDYQDP